MAGFSPNDIIFTPNGVSIEEIKKAVTLGVRINIDNLSILEQFGSIYWEYLSGMHKVKPTYYGRRKYEYFGRTYRFKIWDQHSPDQTFRTSHKEFGYCCRRGSTCILVAIYWM